MIIPKEVFGLKFIASDDESRYALNGIYFDKADKEKSRATATDGVILLSAEWNNEPEDKFLSVPEDKEPSKRISSGIVPLHLIESILKALSSTARSVLDALKNKVKLVLFNDEIRGVPFVKSVSTNLDSSSIIIGRQTEAQFPNFENLGLPADLVKFKVGLSVEVLEKLLKAMKFMKIKVIALGFSEPTKPVNIDAEDSMSGLKINGALMPFKLNH